MSKSADRRARWFTEGASKLRPVLGRLGLRDRLPDTGDYYACPCCLVAYPREALAAGALTEEHVPPEGLGGRGLLLTCADCNSNAGTKFDAHAVRRADAHDFMRGATKGSALPATFHADGIPLRGTARWTDDGLQLFGVPQQNDPKVQAAWMAALDAHVDRRDPSPDISFTIHMRFDEARARVSWIRSAYLAAFAALGWSYILRPVMQPIRDQLSQPHRQVIPTYLLRSPEVPPVQKRILLADYPDELRCVAVVMGEHTVFLPGLSRPMTCDELADAFRVRRGRDEWLRTDLSGKEVPWPTASTYFLD